MKKILLSLSGTLLLLSACSSPTVPSSAASVPTASGTTPPGVRADLIISGELSGAQVTSSVAALSVKPQALSGSGEVTVSALKPSQAPALPPVAVVNSSYLIGEVPGVRVRGVWNVKAKTPEFKAQASLILRPDDTLTPQSAGTITEIFVRDNVKGSISLVGTFPDSSPLEVGNFADQLNTLRGSADLTYWALTSAQAKYNATCKAQGGDTELGYCSFRNKVVTAPLKAQSLGSAMRVLSYNVGNVAVSCEYFRFKVCYSVTERKVSDQILAQEAQGGKPGIIMLQELWHGDCRNIASSWYNAMFNPRVCDGNSRGVPSISRILGTRYSYTCTTVQLINNDPRNGYECTAIDSARLYWTSLNALGNPDGSGLHPYCADTDKWIDTGFQVTRVQHRYAGTSMLLVNTHLAGTTDNNCRASQIAGLSSELRRLGKPDVLIMGDFNTEPYNDSLAGGQRFRRDFVTPLQNEAIDPVATMIDSGTESTAQYVWGSPALDHVLGRGIEGGGCMAVRFYDGTDHAMTNCYLY